MNKRVEYKETSYSVPDWAKFIGGDSDSSVWCYSNRPHWNGEKGAWEQQGGLACKAVIFVDSPELKEI